MITILKILVGAFVATFVALIFVMYTYTKCKNDDPDAFLNKVIGVTIGITIMALGIWVLS